MAADNIQELVIRFPKYHEIRADSLVSIPFSVNGHVRVNVH